MRHLAFVLLFFCLTASAASVTTYRAGSRLLAIGDTSAKIRDALGEPAKVTPIENKYGAHVADWWVYYDGSKTIKFYIDDDRIQFIDELR